MKYEDAERLVKTHEVTGRQIVDDLEAEVQRLRALLPKMEELLARARGTVGGT